MNLRKFLLVGASLLVIFLLGTLYFSVNYVVSAVHAASILRHSQQTAESTFNSLYQVMRRGWSRAELEEFLAAMSRQGSEAPQEVLIHRSRQVSEEFGTIEQPPMSPEAAAVFVSGRPADLRRDGDLVSFYPIVAKAECLGCHRGAEAGQVLGVIEVRSDIQGELDRFNREMLKIIVPLAIFPLLGAVVLGFVLHRRIFAAIHRFRGEVGQLHRIADLARVETEPGDYPLEEFNLLKQETNALIGKIKQIAVDKETLEFEIRLLEKLLITSEVVRDWRDHVKSLLIEINQVMDIPFLFAMFHVDDKAYEMEVFWLRAPEARLKRHLEEMITATVRREFPDLSHFALEHLTAISLGQLEGVGERHIDIHTKKIFLDAPRIGGIVGIGLLTREELDQIKLLVVEGILTTMLNVIGSVKAIYKYTREVEYYSSRDPLTGLYNQRFFRELFEQEILRTQRNQSFFSLLLLDLDNFKTINDQFGHGFGDQCIQALAGVLQGCERAGDIIARFGGDEFVLLLPDAGQEQAWSIAERLAAAIRSHAVEAPDGTKVTASVSMGLVTCPDHGDSVTDCLLMAEKMLEKAKKAGKNNIMLPSDDDLIELFRGKSEMALLLKRTLDENKVIPYFQPIYDLRRREIAGHEVLMRIHDGEGRVVPAQDFIEIAEDMGIINRLDLALMEKVFEQLRLDSHDGLIFLNISPRDLVHREFMGAVDRLVAAYRIDPGRVVFEITEREAIRNLSLVEKFVLDLKMKGFRFALDDFGSGYSSYFYLKKFPIDYIKIEGDFVRGMLDNEVDLAVVESIVVLARRIGVKVIAEFVESDRVLSQCRELDVDLAQGYHLARPEAGLLRQLPGGKV